MAKSTFAKVLGEGGYEVVAAAGDGVLEITPNILDVYINAPATSERGPIEDLHHGCGLGDARVAGQ